jgi:hypothetical protein
VTSTVRLLFLQDHRETDRFFTASGVQFAPSTSGQFYFRRAAFSSHLKSKSGNILAKTATLRIILNIDLWCQDHTLTHHTRKPLVY